MTTPTQITTSKELADHIASLHSGAQVDAQGVVSGLKEFDPNEIALNLKHKQYQTPRAIDRAGKAMSLQGDTIVSKGGNALPNFETLSNDVTRAAEELEGAKKQGFAPEHLKGFEKRHNDAVSALQKAGEKAKSSLEAGVEAHTGALNALHEEEKLLKEEMSKHFGAKSAPLYDARSKVAKNAPEYAKLSAQIEQLETNHKAALEHVGEHFDGLRKPHSEVLEKAREANTTLGKHGVKTNIAATAAEAGAAKTFSLKQIGNNWSKTGFAGKAKASIGSAVAIGFGVSGAKDVLTGLGVLDAGQNPDGSEKEAGGIFSGAAKLAVAAGGLWAAGHGGHSL